MTTFTMTIRLSWNLPAAEGNIRWLWHNDLREKNFVGIDIKGARLWRGAKDALELKLANVAFLRIPIETMTNWFAAGEIDEIWITFPDPYLREGKARKRLTSPRFLALYRQSLQAGRRYPSQDGRAESVPLHSGSGCERRGRSP